MEINLFNFSRRRLLVTIFMLVTAVTGIQADSYITEIMTIGTDGNGGSLKTEYRNKGWTVVDKDLNGGAGGWYVYIVYKTSSTAKPESDYITDICASDKNVGSFTFEGRTYYKASNNPGFNGDMNRGAGGADIFIYYTRDRIKLGSYGGDKRVITKLSTTSDGDDSDSGTAAISWRNSKYSGLCELNRGAGGDYIYLQQHFTTQTTFFNVEPTFASNLTFNGGAQELVSKDPWAANQGYGILKYRVNNGAWSSAVPKATNVGDYKVEAYLDGTSVNGITFANNSKVISKTVTINPPIAKASDLNAVFNQGDKKVNLSWNVDYIPGYYSDYNWVVYRDGVKIATLDYSVHTYADTGFTNEASLTYDVYYVSKFWNEDTKRDDTKTSVTVSTVRTVPVNNLLVEQLDDRIVFTWTSDGYAQGFGNKFRIYVGNEEDPIYTLKASDMQTSFRWEHRSTDQHANRQNKIDEETGVPYTEEPLNACAPLTYRIEGVIDDVVLNTYDINPKAIGNGTLFYSLDASKGVYEGSVKLSWRVNQQGSVLVKTYIVERRRAEQEGEAWETLARMSSTEENLLYTDQTALPGVYYDYRVTVEDKCSDGTIISNDVTNIGFAKSSGTVTGRIAYGSTGTSVQDVEVVMTKNSSEGGELEQFHSMYFTDVNGAVTWKYPAEGDSPSSENYAARLFATSDFSVQMWLFPESFSNSKIVNFGNSINIGMTTAGQLTFNNGTSARTFDGITLRKNEYNHVVLTRSGTKLTCYVLNVDANSSEPIIQKGTKSVSDSQWSLAGATQLELGHFKGAVDEFRLWAKCLSETDIVENFDHLLVGDEKSLETYWTFDEGLRTQFFDYSRDGTNYRKHHGHVGSNAQASTLTPSALALKAKTDKDGNYIIQGIPFTGEGTTYSVVPMFGIHEFNPNKKLLFVGSNALVHTADFEDVSSFMMSGHIYYAGTNVPVEGAQMFVDGQLQTSDGKVEQTDENGYYEISVPIGKHFVEAKIDDHKMVDGGRWPTQGTFYFDRRVQHDFSDSTLVNFVGRVSGSERNDTLAVGFGVSNNNIGIATVQLALNNESFSLNCQDDHISDATSKRTWESDTIGINSSAWTGIDYDAKYIYIRTDSLTGEFSALLPPLKYRVKSLRINTNPDIDFGSLPEIDLSNVKANYADTLRLTDEDGNKEQRLYSYNTKMVKTFFANPQLELCQMTVNGEGDAPKGVFGRKSIEDYTDDFGTTNIDNIWTIDKDGKATYTYKYPIYDGGDKVKMSVWGYETYVNNDADVAVADTVALNAQVVTISNEMSDEQMVVARVDNEALGLQPGDIYNLKTDQLILDARGKNEFTFMTGAPNIAAPYTRQLSMSIERNNRTYTYDGVNAIVLGALTTGTNFITLGPDKVAMVLRDPPGATSKTTWTTGTAKTKMRSTAHGFYGDEKFNLTFVTGMETQTFVGLGTIVEFGKVKALTDKGGGFHYSVNRVNQTDETWSVTATKSVSTGTGPTYVGSDGDVYIGASTNIIVGNSRKLGFFRKGKDYPFELDLKDALSMGDSLTTTFMYSGYELEKVMIPKWEETRHSLFTFVKDKKAAENYVNTSDHCVYATWLSENDPQLGLEDSTYVQILPKNPEPNKFYNDSVLWCTSQINRWRQVMANNEKDKLNAINNSENFIENLSFDGGSPNSFSDRCDTTYQYKESYNHKLGGIFNIGGVTEGSGASIVFKTSAGWTTENGWSMATVESDPDDNTKEWAQFDYSLSDGNKGTDFSVNVYKSSEGWSNSFFLVGGQSYNPYEGEEKTKYYYPGQYTLSNGTERMEKPDIRISIDGNADNSAKHVILNDVPAGQSGQLTLHLQNLSPTTQGFDFSYNIMVQEKANQKGLEILMDGVPANGRSIFIPAGEMVKKVITVRQTDQSVLDYTGLELRFCSQYQPIKIYDIATFDVHFKPSSSPIDLAISEPILNIETMARTKGEIDMKVTNFDRQFKGMKKLGVEYRYEGSTTWTQPSELQFVVNEEEAAELGGKPLPAEGDLRLKYNMSDANFYPQGTYTFRAYTMTKYGKDEIYVYSKEIAVVKDDQAPRQLSTPAPTNGILGYGDDIMVEFNEDIVPGYVSDKNIIVTAKLNSQAVQHDVAKFMIDNYGVQRTVNPVFINGDFSVEFWMMWGKSGSILDHGKGRFVISIDDEGHVAIDIAGTRMVSKDVLPMGEWVYFAMSCNTTDLTLSALAQYGTTMVPLFTNEPVPVQTVQAIDYYEDNYMYLGSMTGAIHDLCFYSICRDLKVAAAEKYLAKDNYVYGLQNYWPMDEGHGNVAHDRRHTHDFMTNDLWTVGYDSHALEIIEGKGVQADISRINTDRSDSYAIEMWAQTGSFKENVREQTVFETGSAPADKLRLYYDTTNNLVLQYGEKQHVVAAYSDFPAIRNWHHLALNVVRGQAASFYYDGQRTAVISEYDVPPLRGNAIHLGEGMGAEGRIDEVRIWHATLSESRILNNMYNVIDTASVYSRGLVAYYPFEKDGVRDGIAVKVSTCENMAPGATASEEITGTNTDLFNRYAPPLKGAPVESRLMARPIASERKVVVNLIEGSGITARDIEGTTLNITVDGIHDMHGNESAPIRWTAYVQRNTLKWAKDSVTVIKQYGDDYYFDVDITNNGGRTEYYTLCNMPSWLTLVDALDGSPVDPIGDLAPLSKKTLRFKVMSTMPVGNYDVTMSLQGNDEILEPLRVKMKVRGEAPAWTVDPNKYENTMGVVGQVYINGVLMSLSESRVAAFIDGECRGVADIQPIRGAAFVAMSIYGTSQQMVNGVPTDLDKGKTVTFRIWDASKGVAYSNVNITLPDGTNTASVEFDDTKIYGDFNKPVIFTKSNLMEQELKLKQNWNWISLNVEPVDTKTSVVLNDIASWSVYLKDRSTGTYYSNGTYWDGTLTDMHANTMYKLNLTKMPRSKELPSLLPVTGNPVKLSETKVTLKKNWNWIAYLPQTSMTLDMALAGANPQEGDMVKSQQGFSIYGRYGWSGNLNIMESGKGYLYYSVDDATKEFVYPAESSITAGSRAMMTSDSSELSVFVPVDPGNYPDNMSMVVKLVRDNEPVTDVELSAFVDNECRGAATVSETSGLYYLLIAGEGHDKPMEIRAAINGDIITVCTSVLYDSDAIIGTPWEPFVINLSDTEGISTITADEADTEWYTLQGFKIGHRPTTSGVYIHRGQKVMYNIKQKSKTTN